MKSIVTADILPMYSWVILQFPLGDKFNHCFDLVLFPYKIFFLCCNIPPELHLICNLFLYIYSIIVS